ncbi:unnamed protein product, partial [Sphenostylis stenocarpa]
CSSMRFFLETTKVSNGGTIPIVQTDLRDEQIYGWNGHKLIVNIEEWKYIEHRHMQMQSFGKQFNVSEFWFNGGKISDSS